MNKQTAHDNSNPNAIDIIKKPYTGKPRGFSAMDKEKLKEARAKGDQKRRDNILKERKAAMKRAERLGEYTEKDFYEDAATLAEALADKYHVNESYQDVINAYVVVQNVIDYAQTQKNLLDVFEHNRSDRETPTR